MSTLIFYFTFTLHSIFFLLAPWPDLGLLPQWWSKKIDTQTAESWRRHFRSLRRRKENKINSTADNQPALVVIYIPEDLDIYFGPPSVYISLPQGILP